MRRGFGLSFVTVVRSPGVFACANTGIWVRCVTAMPLPRFSSPFGRRQTPTNTSTAVAGEHCPDCGRSYDSGKRRAVTDHCGHSRCRACTRDRKRRCHQCAVGGDITNGEVIGCRSANQHGTVSYFVLFLSTCMLLWFIAFSRFVFYTLLIIVSFSLLTSEWRWKWHFCVSICC